MTDDLGRPARSIPRAWRVGPGHALLFAAVLAVGVALRFYRITELPAALYPDEAFYGTDTLRSMASGVWRVFYPLNNGHEGLIVWAHAPFILAFGTTPWVLRLQPAVLGSLTLIAILPRRSPWNSRTASLC